MTEDLPTETHTERAVASVLFTMGGRHAGGKEPQTSREGQLLCAKVAVFVGAAAGCRKGHICWAWWRDAELFQGGPEQEMGQNTVKLADRNASHCVLPSWNTWCHSLQEERLSLHQGFSPSSAGSMEGRSWQKGTRKICSPHGFQEGGRKGEREKERGRERQSGRGLKGKGDEGQREGEREDMEGDREGKSQYTLQGMSPVTHFLHHDVTC